jgi:putative drug exporter of the RND superfamily
MGFLSPGRLARTSAAHPWITVGLWVVIIVAAVFSASNIRLTDEQRIPGSDSDRAQKLLETRLRGPIPPMETIVVQSETLTVDDAAFQALVTSIVNELRGMPGTVTTVMSFYETGDPSLVSADRQKTILPAVLTGKRADATETVKPLLKVLDRHEGNGFIVLTAGDGSILADFQHTAESDLSTAEKYGLPLALIVLVLVFGAGVAAGVPVLLAILGILVSVGITAGISQIFSLNSFTTNMIIMLGLALGIDYTLFIVERVREERRNGLSKVEAISRAGDTSGRAVLFSGITVVIALTGLLIVPNNVFQGMAIGTITAVLSAVVAAMTLLPAVLSLLGDRINWLRLPGRNFKKQDHSETGGFFGRTTAVVMRHPVIAAGLAVVLLLAMAIPYYRIEIGTSGVAAMPAKLESVQAFKILDADFSAGRVSPTEIVIDGDLKAPAVQEAVAKLRAQLASDPMVGGVGELDPNERGDLALITIFINGDAYATDSIAIIERIRTEYVPAAFAGTGAKVYVGGNTAGATDYIQTMNQYLPIVIVFVLSLSFLLLMMVFRSIVIPVKAIIMNLLSVGAAYGMLVLVFQEGVGANLLGFQQSENIAAFLPVFLFAILFGLSMDYHVFLLSRIQERFLETRDNAGSVAYGLRSTAHIITGAAAIMVIVFGGFAMGDMAEMQQMGFGLAVAVFLDATIVRSVLVPATMELLGDKNWYFPSWLAWLPKIHVEGAPAPRVQPAPSLEPVYGRAALPVSGD